MVLKWRALPTSMLKDVSGYQGHSQSFNRVIKKLEMANLVNCIRFNGATKLIYPSKDLIKMTSSSNFILADNITHDGLSSIVINELLSWEKFNEAKLPHEMTGESNEGLHRVPDAILTGRNNGKQVTLALEVELSRKSKLRVRNKLHDYSNNRVFNYVFYVFNDKGTFESYKNILSDFISSQVDPIKKEEILSRFILGLRDNIIHHKFKLDDSKIFYRGEITKLDSIFGKKRLLNQ
jgi:hypothetical protein